MTFWKKWLPPAKELPLYVKEYRESFTVSPPRNTPVDELRFVVFDTETSGLDPKQARLLSLGAVVVQGGTLHVHQSLEMTAYAPQTKVHEHVAIHGLTQRELQAGESEAYILENWLAFIRRAVLVAHHAAFDMAVMNRLCKQHYGIKLKNQTLDTAYLAKRLEHGTQLNEYIRPEEYSLDLLCERYDIRPDDRHTAAGDAFITAKLLLKLLAKARQSGITTLGELVR